MSNNSSNHGGIHNANDDSESNQMNDVTAIQQGVPGKMAIDIILTHMLSFIKDDNIQLIGLDLILKCLQLHTSHSGHYSTNGSTHGSTERTGECSMFVNERCATVLVKLLQSKRKYEVQWRSHVLLMKLTHHYNMCNYLERSGGCHSIMALLNDATYKQENKSVYQMALWILTNLCRVGK